MGHCATTGRPVRSVTIVRGASAGRGLRWCATTRTHVRQTLASPSLGIVGTRWLRGPRPATMAIHAPTATCARVASARRGRPRAATAARAPSASATRLRASACSPTSPTAVAATTATLAARVKRARAGCAKAARACACARQTATAGCSTMVWPARARGTAPRPLPGRRASSTLRRWWSARHRSIRAKNRNASSLYGVSFGRHLPVQAGRGLRQIRGRRRLQRHAVLQPSQDEVPS